MAGEAGSAAAAAADFASPPFVLPNSPSVWAPSPTGESIGHLLHSRGLQHRQRSEEHRLDADQRSRSPQSAGSRSAGTQAASPADEDVAALRMMCAGMQNELASLRQKLDDAGGSPEAGSKDTPGSSAGPRPLVLWPSSGTPPRKPAPQPPAPDAGFAVVRSPRALPPRSAEPPPSLAALPGSIGFSTFDQPWEHRAGIAAAHTRYEAEAARAEPPFVPTINEASARLQRSMPVEELLIGKGQAAKSGAARTRALLEAAEARESQRAAERAAPQRTKALAARYAERVGCVGQSSAQRLSNPRRTGIEHARLADAVRRAREEPFAPNVRTGPRGAIGAVARQGSGGGHGGGPGFATISPERSRPIEERSAAWAKGRAERIAQLARRTQAREAAECVFQPRSHGAAYVAANGGGALSGRGVVARTHAWAEVRDLRREQAQRVAEAAEAEAMQVAAQARRAAEASGRRAGSLAPPLEVVELAEGAFAAMGEPQFMASTEAWESYRRAEVRSGAAPEEGEAVVRGAAEEVPEWAAPKAV